MPELSSTCGQPSTVSLEREDEDEEDREDRASRTDEDEKVDEDSEEAGVRMQMMRRTWLKSGRMCAKFPGGSAGQLVARGATAHDR